MMRSFHRPSVPKPNPLPPEIKLRLRLLPWKPKIRCRPPHENTIVKMKKKSLKSNLGEIRVCNENPKNMTPTLVDYLGMVNTDQLREFIMNAVRMLRLWRQARTNEFNVKKKTSASQWLKVRLWTYVIDKNSLTSDKFSVILLLFTTYTGLQRDYISYVMTMYAVLKSDTIPWATLPTWGEPALRGFEVEQWNRSYERFQKWHSAFCNPQILLIWLPKISKIFQGSRHDHTKGKSTDGFGSRNDLFDTKMN